MPVLKVWSDECLQQGRNASLEQIVSPNKSFLAVINGHGILPSMNGLSIAACRHSAQGPESL